MGFGKIIGAIFGWMFAGPLGAILGIVIGHNFDRGMRINSGSPFFGYNPQQQARIQEIFFTATFNVMGKLAKADGRVSEDEIRAARDVMRSMHLNPQQKQQAIKAFNEGKRASFNLDYAIDMLLQNCRGNPGLLRMFVEIQLRAAFVDGQPAGEKLQLLNKICQRLGFIPNNFYGFNQRSNYQQHQQRYRQAPQTTLKSAYDLLEIAESASDKEIKRAYRKQMSQHHPDKLVAKGLPDSMIKLATEKTQKVRAAYDQICAARGI